MTDRKNLTLISGILLFVILFMSMASAVSININPINFDAVGDKQLFFDSFLNNDSISLALTSNLDPYMSLQFNSISQDEQYANIYLDQMPTSNIEGFLFYGTQSTLISISVPEQTQSADNFISFPSTKNFEYKQGDIYNEILQLRLSSSYPNPIKITYVEFSPSTSVIRQGNGLETGLFINPGESFSIPLIIDTTEAQSGSYPPVEVSIEYDDDTGLHTMKSTVTLYVTAGVTPVTGDTFSTSPTCSLSANTVNLNNTYSFTCSGIVSNLEVVIPSSEFYIGKNVEVSSGIYRYDFMPIEYGVTEFKAEFRYNGASIFTPFKQELRISSSGSAMAGTDLKLLFTPRLDEATGDEESYLIQLADNRTGSLVSNPRVFVNAIEINSSSDTFQYAFEPNKDYQIRGKAIGYDDLVETINIVPQKIEIRITPGTGDSSTLFNITTSVENATLTILGTEYIGSYYGVLRGGDVEIQAVKEGYKIEIINFTVDDRVKIISFGGEFKKGISQNFTLNNGGNWVVYYKDKMDSLDRSEYARGIGEVIAFTPEKNGAYVVEVEGIHVGTFEIPGFSFSNKWGFLPAWTWLLFITIIIIVIIVVYARKNQGTTPDSGVPGLDFHVGDN